MSDAHESNPHTGSLGGHDDPMSHVPPGSWWPLIVSIGLILVPFGVLSLLGTLHVDTGNLHLPQWTWSAPSGLGGFLLAVGGLIFLFGLMGWGHQIIREKTISHDLVQQQKDLKQFILLFLVSELAVFGAIFAYFYHRKIWDAPGDFGPHGLEGLHLGGALVAYATFILISSSITCEIAHRALEHGQRSLAKFMLLTTIILGVIFLGFQGYEYGELIARGFTPANLTQGPAAFSSWFYISTGFHGVHVAIGLVMLTMVLLRMEVGHFRGRRQFSMIAASWYWHFVDIVWILLFISVYVVA